jgi:hypothetical protein
MSTLEQALSEIGYQPTMTRPKEEPTIETVIDGLMEPVTCPLKIVFRKAGGMIKARYGGRKTFVFGYDERHAVSRLKYWNMGAA